MARLYSKQLAVLSVVDGFGLQTYTVPSGFRTVILEYSGDASGVGAPGAGADCVGDPLGNTLWEVFFPPFGGRSFCARRHQVLNAGDSFTLSASAPAGEVDVGVYGWELTLP